jgi:hypothetical protein
LDQHGEQGSPQMPETAAETGAALGGPPVETVQVPIYMYTRM